MIKFPVERLGFLSLCAAKKLEIIIPHLDIFTKSISKIHLDSAIRPVAKICEYLAKAYYAKGYNEIQKCLTSKHKEKIVESCFDWMINDEKIAPKAYAMNSLYLFGRDFEWVHPELSIIIKRDYEIQSSGFKARARHILKKLDV